jgi:hypothetical protein
VTRLRKMMLEELRRRNYSAIATRNYLRVVTPSSKNITLASDQKGLRGGNSGCRHFVPTVAEHCASERQHRNAHSYFQTSGVKAAVQRSHPTATAATPSIFCLNSNLLYGSDHVRRQLHRIDESAAIHPLVASLRP